MSLSEIRVNTTKTRTGVGTITYTETGPVITGIATASNFKTGSTNVHSTGVEVANINTGGSTATFGGAISGTTASFSGTVSIGGTLTYEDVTNIDAVGIITAKAGVRVPDGGRDGNEAHIRIGDDGDFRMYHEAGAHTTLENHSSSSDLILMTSSAARDIIFKTNGNNERLRITSAGAVGINSTTPTTGYKLDVNGDLTLGEISGTDNTFIDQKQDGDLHIINSGRTAQGASGTPGTAGVGINRFNNISGGTTLFRDFTVYNGKNSKVLVVDGSASAVGIGTDAPAYELHVWPPAASSSGQICAQSNGNDTFAELVLKTDGGTGSIWRNSSAKTTYGGANSLNIYQSAAAPIAFFTDGNNERLRISSTGKIIIGNSGTAYGNGSVQSFIAHTANAGTSGFNSIDTTSVAAGVGGEISFYGKYNSGAQDYAYLGHIRGIKENATAGNTACALTFHTRPTAAAPVERLRIRSNGNVAINNSTGSILEMTRTSTSTSGLCGKIVFGNTDWDSSMASIQSYQDGGNDNASLRFYTQASAAGGEQESFRIDSSGRLGVGNVAPADYSSGFDDLVIKTASNSGITIVSGTSSQGTISFADGTSGDAAYRGYIQYSHTPDTLAFGAGGTGTGGDRAILSKYGMFTLESGSQGGNSKPGIELKSTGYTGNITRLFQDSPNANSVLETTERSLLLDIDSANQVNGSCLTVEIDGVEEFRFDPGILEFKNNTNLSRGTLLGGINYHSNTNAYVDLTQWRLSDNWNHLEVFGYVNPNGAGSGQYTDPVHMYIYRGIGWANGGIKHFIYSVHVAPPARQAFPGGSGMSGNSGVSAVWCNSGSVVGNESATGTHYIRLVIPNANASSNFQKTFRILRRF